MPGIFGGHIFEGFGQVKTDPSFDAADKSSMVVSDSKSGGKSGGAAFIPGVAETAAYLPPAQSYVGPEMIPPASSSNTTLYVVAGGALVIGAIAYLAMGRRGKVTPNRRARRRR